MSMMVNEDERMREMIPSKEVLAMIPINRHMLIRLEKDGLFPQGHFVSPHNKLWFRDEVIKWQRDLQDPNSELSKAMQARLQKTKGE